MNNKIYNPGCRIGKPGVLFLLLAFTLLTGCEQISAIDNKGMILGVARMSSQNSSAKERAQLSAEANALKLLQLCRGGEFLIEVREDGAVATTLRMESNLISVNSSQLSGAEGYSFVAYDMPKAGPIPEKYGKIKPEVFAISGKAENVIQLVADQINQRGSKILKENGTTHDSIYVEVKKISFKIKDVPPTFRLKLFMWIGNQKIN